MPKGPPPRLDLSKKNLEQVRETDWGSYTNHQQLTQPTSKSLQTLFLQNNRLTSFPNTINEKLVFLKVLYLNGNLITKLPDDFGRLNQLTKLHLENNQLQDLPSSIGELVNLKKLYLGNNLLESLPDGIGKLTQLQTLHLQNNQLRCITPFIAAISTLRELNLSGNPIQSPPPFVYSNNSLPFIMHYLKEQLFAVLETVPEDPFIFTRKIDFKVEEGSPSSKKTPAKTTSTGGRNLSKGSFVPRNPLSSVRRKGKVVTDRELKEDSLVLNQNHLLYFLSNYAIYETQGRREYMEDRAIALPRLHQRRSHTVIEDVVNMFSKIGYYGVFDGHGGDRCAQYLMEILHKNICNQDSFAKGDFETAIRTGFARADQDFLTQCRENYYMDGSTCAIAMIVDNKLITAHAGDSRIVLCRDKTAIRLTEDHKPDKVEELTRIEDAGGEVIFRGNCFRVSGDLAMSRSFGDLRLKEPLPLVISDPDIRMEELTPKDQFIIVASDGLWDVMSDQKACDIVRKSDSVEEGAKRLVDYAMALGTMDNTTAIVIRLNWFLDFLTNEEVEGKITVKKASGGKVGSASPQLTPKGRRQSAPPASESTGVKELPVKQEENSKNSNAVASGSNSENNSPSNLTPIGGKEENTGIPEVGAITEEQLARTRSSSFSLRDGMEDISGNSRKSIYLPTSSAALKLKVVIPDLAATKLMKFDTTTTVKEIIQVLLAKHRFDHKAANYVLLHKKGDEPNSAGMALDPASKISFYKMQDNDIIELKSIKGESKKDEKSSIVSPSETVQQPDESKNDFKEPKKLLEVAVGLYTLEDENWKSLDQERSKLSILLLEAKKPEKKNLVKLEAKSSSNEQLFYLWMGLDTKMKKTSGTFYELEGKNGHYGLSFQTKENAEEFQKVFEEEREKLKSSTGLNENILNHFSS